MQVLQNQLDQFEKQAKELVKLALDISSTLDEAERTPQCRYHHIRSSAIITLDSLIKTVVLLLRNG